MWMLWITAASAAPWTAHFIEPALDVFDARVTDLNADGQDDVVLLLLNGSADVEASLYINSGAGLFLYGEPGNGKSTLAKQITQCFGQDVWIPQVIIEDGQLIKLFDAAFHEPSTSEESGIVKTAAFDRRWIKIRRPT